MPRPAAPSPMWQMLEVWYCPLDEWLLALTQGWRLPWIASPMSCHHGRYAVLVEREVNDRCRSAGNLNQRTCILVEGTFHATKHGKRLKTEPKPVGNLSEPPAWFNEGQREVWSYGLRHAPLGLLKAIDLGTYVAWCVACDTHRLAAEQLAKMGVKGLD